MSSTQETARDVSSRRGNRGKTLTLMPGRCTRNQCNPVSLTHGSRNWRIKLAAAEAEGDGPPRSPEDCVCLGTQDLHVRGRGA